MTERILTITDAAGLAELLRMVETNAKVARLGDDGNIVYGMARSIGNDTGGFIRRDEDVRDAYMRVTLRSGWEAFWPIAELLPEVFKHTYTIYDW